MCSSEARKQLEGTFLFRLEGGLVLVDDPELLREIRNVSGARGGAQERAVPASRSWARPSPLNSVPLLQLPLPQH